MPTTVGGTPIQVDMLSRDYESIRADIFELAITITPNWTDFSEYEPMVVLAESMAYIGDNLSYYLDRIGNNNLLDTCQDRDVAKRITRFHFGYTMKSAMSATVALNVVFDPAYIGGYPYTLPAGTEVNTTTITGEEAKTYATESDIIVPAHGTQSIMFTHGSMIRDEILGNGNAKANQKMELNFFPVSIDSDGRPSVKLYVYNGAIWQLWTEKSNFFDSNPTDKHYVLEWGSSDKVTVIFGDNLNGAVCPSGSNNVKATYRIGGGVSGNQAAINTVTKVVDTTLLSISGGPIISVTNPLAPTGGKSEETIAEARVNAQKEKRTQNRLVSYDDYEAACFTYPGGGVAKAKAWVGRGPFETIVMIASEGSVPTPTGTWNPITETGSGLLGGLGSYLNDRKVGPMWIDLKGPKIVKPKIKAKIEFEDTIYQVDGIEAVKEAFNSLFAFTYREFGEGADLGASYQIIKEVTGVKQIDIEEHHRKAYADYVRGSDFVIFSQITSSQDALEEELTIEFISGSYYEVTGSKSGKQLSIGICDGSKFITDNGAISFRASFDTLLGTEAIKGTRYKICIGEWAGNINITNEEIIVEGDYDLTYIGGIG